LLSKIKLALTGQTQPIEEGHNMLPTKFSKRTLLVACALLALAVVQRAAAQEKADKPASKADLTPESFPKIHKLVRPHDNEWRHLKVDWLTDVVAARRKAVAEDKPIVICYTGGAGYNEPLGVC
jgi:hypothetical protein